MGLDSYEQRRFNLSNKIKSQNHVSFVKRDGRKIRYNGRIFGNIITDNTQQQKCRIEKKQFTPIHKSDMSLDKLLKEYPGYRYQK